MNGVVDLLCDLVRIPSVSGTEEACRDALVRWLRRRGVAARTHGRNVHAVIEGADPAADGLLLCSHIDVVPVGDGWTRDPWAGHVEAGRIHGRGANDAKASVAAMAWVAAHVDTSSLRGRLVLAFVCDEETGGEGLEVLKDALEPFAASVIGEPTELDVCPGQRGLLRATLTARGRSCHASRPWEGENAVVKAARDVLAIDRLDLGEEDPVLGRATLESTVIAGGTRPNVLPGECVVELDGRSTPACDNDAMLARLQAVVASDVVVRSKRFLPVSTPASQRIVRLALDASPTKRLRPFGGVSDLFHVRHRPGVVMGPGTSEQSHAADESIAVDQVEAAVTAYGHVVRSFLGGRVKES